MSKKSYIHFKLTSGEEVLCEIVSEPEGEDMYVVVRNAMKVSCQEHMVNGEGYRYYGFRPWMVFQNKSDQLQLINFTQIAGEAKPDKTLLAHYLKAIAEEEQRETPGLPEEVDEDATITELKAWIAKQHEDDDDLDSDSDKNVIQFNPRSTMH